MDHLFVIGLGSNLGAREQNLSRAVEQLARSFERIEAVSRVYESAPVGPPQPDYLNAAVRLVSARSPEAVLDGLHAIEAAFGRTREVRWGPRVLDLDVLWSDEVCSTARLTVPHAQLRMRAFALAPLLDVAPELSPIYGPALQALGGAPRVRGHLSFDRVSQTCAVTWADEL